MIAVSTDARVGLLGNPGDGYGGRVLAFTIADFAASVTAEPTRDWNYGSAEGAQLLRAGVEQLLASGVSLPQAATLSFTTTIPRQVGLSGSSAIVISAIRAALAVNDQTMQAVDVARLALEAETVSLGITAGPQDRVVQAYGGFIDMDFAVDWDALCYQRLDSGLLPHRLFIAWDNEPGFDSGGVHRDVKERWLAGDAEVRSAIARFREYSVAGWSALVAGNVDAVANLMDANFATRASLWEIGASDAEKVQIAQEHGAGAKLCGSGGAVVGLARDPSRVDALKAAYERAGYGFVVPTMGEPKP